MGMIWNPVPNWDGFFVTNTGKIKGPSGKILRPMKSKTGHLFVTRGKKSIKLYVHRAILMTFKGMPINMNIVGRHLNGNPSDNRIENLEWGTKQENSDDKKNHGTMLYGESWEQMPERGAE